MRKVCRRLLLVISSSLLSISTQAIAADLDCTIEFPRQWSLSFLESGVIEKLSVKAGDRVKAGQLLAALEGASFKAAIQSAKARQASANMQFAESRREQDRSRELYDRTLLSDHEKQLVENDFILATSEKQRADADLLVAKMAMRDSMIKAPADSLVTEVSVSEGEIVNSRYQSKTVIRLVDDASVSANCMMPVKSRDIYKQQQRVKLAVSGEWYDAHISFISPYGVVLGEDLYVPVNVYFDVIPKSPVSGAKAIMRAE